MAEIGIEKAIMRMVCKKFGITPDEVKVTNTGGLNYSISIKPKEKLESLEMIIPIKQENGGA